MLQTITKAPPMTNRKYVKLIDLAQELHLDYDTLYGFIYRHNQKHTKSSQIEKFRLPTTGRIIHIKAEDAAMIRAVFTNPEDYAERIERKPKS